MSTPSTIFSIGEKVRCSNRGSVYEAKILDMKMDNGEWKYLVHYQGWNPRWDEWVTDERLYEFNEVNPKNRQDLKTGKTGRGGNQSRSFQGKSMTTRNGGNSKPAGSPGPSTPSTGGGGGLELKRPALGPFFDENAKVLCIHHGMMYEARILDSKSVNDEMQYFVHYQGWNPRWDEWVTTDRLYEYNEENLKQQQELKAAKDRGKKSGSALPVGTPTPINGSSSKTGGGVILESAGGGLELESTSTNAQAIVAQPASPNRKITEAATNGNVASVPVQLASPNRKITKATTNSNVASVPAQPQPASPKRKITKATADGNVVNTPVRPAITKATTDGKVASTPAPAISKIAIDQTVTPAPSASGQKRALRSTTQIPSPVRPAATGISQNVSDFPETPASTEPKQKRVRPSSAIPTTQISAAVQAPTGPPPVVPIDLPSPAPIAEPLDQFRQQEVQMKMPDNLKDVVIEKSAPDASNRPEIPTSPKSQRKPARPTATPITRAMNRSNKSATPVPIDQESRGPKAESKHESISAKSESKDIKVVGIMEGKSPYLDLGMHIVKKLGSFPERKRWKLESKLVKFLEEMDESDGDE